MLLDGLHVTHRGAPFGREAGLRLLRPGIVGREEEQYALNRNHALADVGDDVLVLADLLDHDLIDAAALDILATPGEDAARGDVDLVADAAQHLGGAVDDRLDQPVQHRFRLLAAASRLGRAVEEDVEGARLVIAYRHQRLVGEDEGHIRQQRDDGVGLADDPRGHVARAVLGIDDLGRLEIVHLLARRDRDAQMLLDPLVLLGRRIEQVDPDHVVGKVPVGVELAGAELVARVGARAVDRQHGRESRCTVGMETGRNSDPSRVSNR